MQKDLVRGMEGNFLPLRGDRQADAFHHRAATSQHDFVEETRLGDSFEPADVSAPGQRSKISLGNSCFLFFLLLKFSLVLCPTLKQRGYRK